MGRGQGHVSNFYIVDYLEILPQSRRWPGLVVSELTAKAFGSPHHVSARGRAAPRGGRFRSGGRRAGVRRKHDVLSDSTRRQHAG